MSIAVREGRPHTLRAALRSSRPGRRRGHAKEVGAGRVQPVVLAVRADVDVHRAERTGRPSGVIRSRTGICRRTQSIWSSAKGGCVAIKVMQGQERGARAQKRGAATSGRRARRCLEHAVRSGCRKPFDPDAEIPLNRRIVDASHSGRHSRARRSDHRRVGNGLNQYRRRSGLVSQSSALIWAIIGKRRQRRLCCNFHGRILRPDLQRQMFWGM